MKENNKFNHYKTEEELRLFFDKWAERIWNSRDTLGIDVKSKEQLAELLYNMEMDKAKQDWITDSLQDYNDEIVSITPVEEEQETMDITVSADNLFYANHILTKNSIGLPQTLDWFCAITSNEALQEENKQILHLLKTRFGNKNGSKSIPIHVNFDKMRYSDLDEYTDMQQNTPLPIHNKGEKKVNNTTDWEMD